MQYFPLYVSGSCSTIAIACQKRHQNCIRSDGIKIMEMEKLQTVYGMKEINSQKSIKI